MHFHYILTPLLDKRKKYLVKIKTLCSVNEGYPVLFLSLACAAGIFKGWKPFRLTDWPPSQWAYYLVKPFD